MWWWLQFINFLDNAIVIASRLYNMVHKEKYVSLIQLVSKLDRTLMLKGKRNNTNNERGKDNSSRPLS